jgi:hypothetical protein
MKGGCQGGIVYIYIILLGVNRKATNVACRGELGKFPLLLTIKKNIIIVF